MPVAEKNTQPKGQAYGVAKQQRDFQQQTKPPAPAPSAQPAPPSPTPGAQTTTPPNLDLGNFLDAIITPTDRPTEPVATGLESFQADDIEAVREWWPVLQNLASDSNAPTVIKEAAARAQIIASRGD